MKKYEESLTSEYIPLNMNAIFPKIEFHNELAKAIEAEGQKFVENRFSIEREK